MPYGSSTVQAFTEALLANLTARAGLAGVTVTDGPPGPGKRLGPEWIMLGDVTGEQEPAAINSTKQPRDEAYTLAVLISVEQQSRADQKTVNDRAFALLDEINQELRGNPRQGVTGVLYATLGGGMRQAKRATSETRECALEWGVRVRARI